MQYTFNTEIRMGTPHSRRLLALKNDFDNIAKGEPSVAFNDTTPQARVKNPEGWHIAPQPYGVWIHGDGEVPEAMVDVVSEFLRRHPDVPDFTFDVTPTAEAPNVKAGVVTITRDGLSFSEPDDSLNSGM